MTSLILSALVATASAAAPAAPVATVLSIVPPGAAVDTEIFAPVDSEGQVVAVRLSAGESAFSVRSVSYELVGASDECDAGAGHIVRVWKSKALRPAASIAGGQVFEVPEAIDGYSRKVSIPLQRAIRLEVGESLFVATEMEQEGQIGMCLAGASVAPKDTLRQFVSPTLETPFAWSTFQSLGAEVSMDIKASGYVVR